MIDPHEERVSSHYDAVFLEATVDEVRTGAVVVPRELATVHAIYRKALRTGRPLREVAEASSLTRGEWRGQQPPYLALTLSPEAVERRAIEQGEALLGYLKNPPPNTRDSITEVIVNCASKLSRRRRKSVGKARVLAQGLLRRHGDRAIEVPLLAAGIGRLLHPEALATRAQFARKATMRRAVCGWLEAWGTIEKLFWGDAPKTLPDMLAALEDPGYRLEPTAPPEGPQRRTRHHWRNERRRQPVAAES